MRNHSDILIHRSKKEAEYFDRFYAEVDTRQRAKNYFVPKSLIKQVTNPSLHPLSTWQYQISILGNLEDKKLLDYGAGDGWSSICFAKAKAKVWAIDISENSIELIRKKAAANAVGNLITAEVQNCYKTRYKTNMFDIIYGGGILHHLDIELAAREISRILHPDGVAVFYEPIRESVIMEVIKTQILNLTKIEPAEQTENEYPLTRDKIILFKKYFDQVNYRQFNVLTTASKLFKSEVLRSYLFRMDSLLMRYFARFEKLGMAVVIELRKPKKNRVAP